MPWRALLRTSSAVWGLLPVCLWMWMFAHQPDFPGTDRYWEAATAQITTVGIIPLSLCAAAGAWEAARLKRSRLASGAAVRTPLAVALSQLRVVWGVGLACVLWALACVAGWAKDGPRGPDLRVVGLLCLLLVAYTAVGYAAGWLFPGVLAVPAVAVATFLWLSYPVTIEPFWLRQLNGTNLTECCAYDRTLDTRALAAPALVATGLLVAAVVAVVARAWTARLAGLLPLALAVLVAVPLVDPLGFDPTKNRDTSALTCAGESPKVCLWPEQADDAEQFGTWVGESSALLRKAGMATPRTYTPTFSRPTRADVISSLVGALMPQSPPACAERRAWAGESAYAPVGVWLELTAGARESDVARRLDDDGKTLSLVHEVRALPVRAQQRWYENNHAALTGCDRKPELNPKAYTGGAT
ncbi:DUF7224 domain-containing protein [Streptomyces lasiicapitis]|uniref:DUF7224 domain-containing protein n=1 Tax=Streptomyces lasiicapitis TaxID=1923961 RepID=UPI00366A1EE5